MSRHTERNTSEVRFLSRPFSQGLKHVLAGIVSAAVLIGADRPVSAAEAAYVIMMTSMGDIYVELNREKAPISVENFLKYVEEEFYDGTIFHRVIPTFMIQGGGFTPDMVQKETRPPIRNEWRNGLKNARGSIAMARTAAPDSATAQFFFNVVDNPRLDEPISGGAGYAVFGKVIHGMDVVDKIRRVPTTTRGQHANVPRDPVVIEHVRTISRDEAMKAAGVKPKEDEEDNDEPSESDTSPDAMPGGEPSPADEAKPAAPGFDAVGSDRRAIELADATMRAMGGRAAWDATRHVTWNFFGMRRHVWDRQTNDVRIEFTDRESGADTVILMNIDSGEGRAYRNGEAVIVEETREEMLERGKAAWINDSYWVFMPYKLKDSGVTLRYLGTKVTMDDEAADVIELTFRDVGLTPQNKYHVYFDRESRLVAQWDYFADAADEEPRMRTPWRNWRRYGKIMLSDDRGENRRHQDLGVASTLPRSVYNSPDPVDWTLFGLRRDQN